jgi:hypothetical protein
LTSNRRRWFWFRKRSGKIPALTGTFPASRVFRIQHFDFKFEVPVCIRGETPYDGADQTRFIAQFLLASVAVTTRD